MRIAILTILFSAFVAAVPSTMSVCAALRTGAKLDGKTVRVAGVWRTSSGTGLFDELVDDTCPELGIIHVVFTGDGLQYPPPQNYKLDVGSAKRAQRIAAKALANHRDVAATIEGVLYVQRKEDYVPARPLTSGVMIPPAHKWYPLVLLVEAVPEIRER